MMKIRKILQVKYLALVFFFFPGTVSFADSFKNYVVVSKSKRQLTVFGEKDRIVKVYSIALGRVPIGDKECEGDSRTPEGKYKLGWINEKSAYYRSIHISYPNQQDTLKAKRKGCPPGGDIYLHGIKNGFGLFGYIHRWFDWTQGCIALKNSEIDELISLLSLPADITIKP